mgnify:FL=1
MSARARLVMKPTTKQVPFVGGLQFCFLTIPQIGFDLDGMADIIDWAPLKRKVCVFDRKLGPKGQLISEWIYVVIVSPKMPTKNVDFCLFGRAEILEIFG